MKTTLHLLWILIFSGSLLAADDPNKLVQQEQIARQQAQAQEKALRSQELQVFNQAKNMAKVRERLAKVRSSGGGGGIGGGAFGGGLGTGMVVPSPRPFPFNLGQPSRRVLVIPGPNTDLKQATEDLTIMSKILADRLQEQGLASWSGWPNTHSIEAMAIDGYGVMFILSVDFPLQKQIDQPTPTQADKGDSVWRNTRDELNNPHWELYHQAPQETAKPYDANQVEKLKETLCDCLKHASNIHSLQGQQWVVVVVEAASGGNTVNVVGPGRAFLRSGTDGQKSTMIIKAHKADIDRFAAKQLASKDFRNLVQIQIDPNP